MSKKVKLNRDVILEKGKAKSVRCSCGNIVARIYSTGHVDVTCSKCLREIGIHSRFKLKCPECGNTSADGDSHSGCDYVYGRRGWRQLGVYDG